MNGHVGEKVAGYEGVHGAKCYGVRNTEGEMLLEFAGAKKLVVLNTKAGSDTKKLNRYRYRYLETDTDTDT